MKRYDLGWSGLSGGRPPRGGRGLKPPKEIGCIVLMMSPPARGAWIETT